ncbi:hypothetical protein HCA61_00445 [Rhodococcus sp. HNM0563]|uniref:hypothetical protein n=1 Tax=unclassified Rhodococcus (in: high G+C Gram-positive bacteria) TaxID=192944 RepID=UPI00146CB68E|nr:MULTISPECIES: hypothetical protein [unclassified Rhodococcus (in: high G+C Gram-positive bacteria)]MCK0093332.1 hypothetical protein [Rhodococcus sp. F64268]NLU60734.1 hypothetical protein [Rhodococcus sp. HNM0563]
MALSSPDRKLIATSALFVVSQANIARVLGSTALTVGTVQTTFSASKYRKILDNLGPAELSRYREHYYWDMFHPLTFAVALRAGARALDDHRPLSPAVRRILLTAPVIAAAGDYAENVAGLYLLDHRDKIADDSVRLASTISVTKWMLAAGCLAYLSQGFLRIWTQAGLRRLRRTR